MTTRPIDPGAHPDVADLEALRTDEASDDVRRHVDGCAACREAVSDHESIASRLAGSTETVDPVPEATDRAVIESLFAEAARIRRARKPRILRFAAAAAAALLIFVGTWQAFLTGDGPEDARRAEVHDPLDVDRSGGVDIVDAYLVARRIRRHEEIPERFDVDGDGTVDARDVERVARAAVSLERSPR